MDEVFYFLHFTGDGGIRDLQAIGESTKPMFFEFETGVSHPGNRTEIKMNRSLVASFDWHIGDKLGLATICGRQMLMSHLAYNTDTGRLFASEDGTRYEWRRLHEDSSAYDVKLYMMPQTIIAKFRLEYEDTPVGPCFAYLQFCFDHDVLLLEAMLALCVNRWMDK